MATFTTAQEFGQTQSTILIINQDRFFTTSLYGQRVLQSFEAEQALLRTENRRIESELTDEEKALTEKRPTMQPDDFRAVADAFDRRVQEIRRIQNNKAEALLKQREIDQQAFAQRAQPLLITLMRDSSASVILDSRTVIMSADAIDITDAAVRRLNALIGDGSPTDATDQ
jgi:Skp family chaperone for outer membrane proteins